MDWLTFISNIWNSVGNFAWPAVPIIGLVLFREPIKKVIPSLKVFRFRGLEIEMVEPQETTDQEINIIVSYLQRSPHSFQWFRDNTEIQYSDKQFGTLVATHPTTLERINISSRHKKKRTSPPGMRLTREYRRLMSDVISKSI